MIHSKTKSSQVNKKEESKVADINEKSNTTNEYISTTVNQINETNDNLSLNLVTGETLGKLSSYLIEDDDNDKVVNISKLDESINYRNTNREENYNNNIVKQSDSGYGLIIKNIINNEKEQNSNPIINVSCLETQTNEINNNDNIKAMNNDVNSNMNIVEQNINNNKINRKDEVFKFKKRKKINLKKSQIIISILLLFVLFIIFIIFIV